MSPPSSWYVLLALSGVCIDRVEKYTVDCPVLADQHGGILLPFLSFSQASTPK